MRSLVIKMVELIQFPWSPFCIVQRRILEYSGAKFKITNIPNGDRSLIWKITRERYYAVPVLRDGAKVIFETDENSQVIAKYIDQKFSLDLFPRHWEGLQDILWRYIENDVEALTFKLNDIYWHEMVPQSDRLLFLRHKERKFGRGCIDRWRMEQTTMLEELESRLSPCEEMLLTRDFLLENRARFVDFELYGMLGNFLYSGHYELPARHGKLCAWYNRMDKLQLNRSAREKLHS
jgi:glutathione S-transferase